MCFWRSSIFFIFCNAMLLSLFTLANPESYLREYFRYRDWAAVEKHIQEHGATIDPNTVLFGEGSPYGSLSPLMSAAMHEKFSIVEKMIEAWPECDIEQVANIPSTSSVLWHASKAYSSTIRPGNLPRYVSKVPAPDVVSLIKTIFRLFPNVNINNRPEDGAHLTIFGYLLTQEVLGETIIREIIDRSPNIDYNATATQGEHSGITPLWLLVYNGYRSTFNHVIRTAKDLDFDAGPSESVFYLLFKKEWWDEAMYVLKNFNNFDVLDGAKRWGKSHPLSKAARSEQWDLCDELIKRLPPNLNIQHSSYGFYDDMYQDFLQHGKYEALTTLLKYGDKPDPKGGLPSGAMCRLRYGPMPFHRLAAYYLVHWYLTPANLSVKYSQASFSQETRNIDFQEFAKKLNFVKEVLEEAALITLEAHKKGLYQEKETQALEFISLHLPDLVKVYGQRFILTILESFYTYFTSRPDEIFEQIAITVARVKFGECGASESLLAKRYAKEEELKEQVKKDLVNAGNKLDVPLKKLIDGKFALEHELLRISCNALGEDSIYQAFYNFCNRATKVCRF